MKKYSPSLFIGMSYVLLKIFKQLYFRRLVHSSLLPDILVREKSYADCILDMNARRDSEITALTHRQQDEMERKIDLLDVSTTSDDINNLLSLQYAVQHETTRKWESELDAKKGHQKNEYKNWITNQSCEQLFSSAMPTPIGNRLVGVRLFRNYMMLNLEIVCTDHRCLLCKRLEWKRVSQFTLVHN